MYTAAIDRNMMADAEVMNPARAAETTAPVIRIENLKKSFGDHLVLKNISFDLEKGDAITIIGSSGSGKSTLLRCINRLEIPSGGKILYHGTEVPADAAVLRPRLRLRLQRLRLLQRRIVQRLPVIRQRRQVIVQRPETLRPSNLGF